MSELSLREQSHPRALMRKRIEHISEAIDRGDMYVARRALHKLESRPTRAQLEPEDQRRLEVLREQLGFDHAEWIVPIGLFTLWATLVWLTLPKLT